MNTPRPIRDPRQGPVLPVQPRYDMRRNQPCPCGSGKKAKKCCLPRLQAMAALPPQLRTQAIVAGILQHWPNAEPTRAKNVPAAVQQRYDAVVAANTSVETIPFESAVIESGNTPMQVGPGTITITRTQHDATETPAQIGPDPYMYP